MYIFTNVLRGNLIFGYAQAFGHTKKEAIISLAEIFEKNNQVEHIIGKDQPKKISPRNDSDNLILLASESALVRNSRVPDLFFIGDQIVPFCKLNTCKIKTNQEFIRSLDWGNFVEVPLGIKNTTILEREFYLRRTFYEGGQI